MVRITGRSVGQESVWAAAASECAADQSRFWDCHDVLFAHTAGRGKGVFAPARLNEYASGLGMDQAAFGRCVDSGRQEELGV